MDEAVVVLTMRVSVVRVLKSRASVVLHVSWLVCRTPIPVPKFVHVLVVLVFEVPVFEQVRSVVDVDVKVQHLENSSIVVVQK